MSPTERVQGRTTRSSPGPPARAFNFLITPPAPTRVSYARTPSPKPPLRSLFTPPTHEEIEAIRGEMLLSHQRKVGRPSSSLPQHPAPLPPAHSAVGRMVPTQAQQASAISQPAPHRPSMPSLSEVQQGTVTAQSQGVPSGSQAPMPVDKRGFPVSSQRGAPRLALGSSRGMFFAYDHCQLRDIYFPSAELDAVREPSRSHHAAASQSHNPLSRQPAGKNSPFCYYNILFKSHSNSSSGSRWLLFSGHATSCILPWSI